MNELGIAYKIEDDKLTIFCILPENTWQNEVGAEEVAKIFGEQGVKSYTFDLDTITDPINPVTILKLLLKNE
jgi:hypothetical protein